MSKFQVPTVGGIRKVIQQSGAPAGTTIAELGTRTVTLAQLAQLIAAATPPVNTGGGNISTGAGPSISVGPGLSGGGPIVGNVPIRLTQPPALIAEDGVDGDPGIQGVPGPQGPQGVPGAYWFGEDGTDGDPGVQGPQGLQGSQGLQGIPGQCWFGEDGADGDFFGFPANSSIPTALVGLTAVKGNASTFMPSDGAPALSQNISPTWSGVHTFAGGLARSSSIAGASLGMDGPFPAVAWSNPSGAADSKIWEVYASATQLVFQTVNDAQSNGTPWLHVSRSANADAGIYTEGATGGAQGQGTFNAKGVFVNSVAVSTAVAANPSVAVGLSAINGTAVTWMRSDAAPALSQNIAPTWTGIHAFTGQLSRSTTTTGVSLGLDGPYPAQAFSKADAALDSKIWETYVTPTQLIHQTVNDAQNAGGVYIIITRNGNTPTLADFLLPVKASLSPLTSTQTQVFTGLTNFKPTATISTGAALTADAALTVTCNENGRYDLDLFLSFYETSVGTGGIQFDLGGGSATISDFKMGVNGFANGASADKAGVTSSATAISFATITTSSTAQDWARGKGTFNVTSPGTVAVRWAQASVLSTASTNLTTGSSIVLTKIG